MVLYKLFHQKVVLAVFKVNFVEAVALHLAYSSLHLFRGFWS
jgi:hypothetical protein